MFQLIILSTLIYFSFGIIETEVKKLNGGWTALMIFPNNIKIPYCHEARYKYEGVETTILCDDENIEFPVFRRELDSIFLPYFGGFHSTPVNETYVMKLVENTTEVKRLLDMSCYINTQTPLAVYRFINDDYVVEYMKLGASGYTETEPNTARLLAKKIPTKSVLQAVVESDEELKHRVGAFMCDSVKYY